jgi:hypothetical protein
MVVISPQTSHFVVNLNKMNYSMKVVKLFFWINFSLDTVADFVYFSKTLRVLTASRNSYRSMKQNPYSRFLLLLAVSLRG